jgi:hypothetical protein
MTRRDYLLAERKCASLRAQLALADIDAVRLALEGGLITAEQAVELLADCDLFRFIEPAPPTQPAEWAVSARAYHEDRFAGISI